MRAVLALGAAAMCLAWPASSQAGKPPKDHKVALTMSAPLPQFPGQNPNYLRVAVSGTLGPGRLRILDGSKQRNGGFSVLNFDDGRIKVRIHGEGVSRIRMKAVSGNGRYRHVTGTLRGTTPPLTPAVQVRGTLRY